MTKNIELLQRNLKAIGAALAEVGATSATITYSGRNDSGDINDITVNPSGAAPGNVTYEEDSVAYVNGKREQGIRPITADFQSALGDVVWDAIQEAGRNGFENNEGGDGELTVYASGFGVLKHSDNYEGDENHDEDVFDAREEGVPFASSLKRLAAALKEAGFSAVSGEYSGSGDSGEGFDISYTPADDESEDRDPPGEVTYEMVTYEWNREKRCSEDVTKERTADFESAFEDIAFLFIEKVMGHRGWEINEGGGGEVTLNAEGVLTVDHYDNGEENSETQTYTWNDELATDEEREEVEDEE